MSLFERYYELLHNTYSTFFTSYFNEKDFMTKMMIICDVTQYKLDTLDSYKKHEAYKKTILYRILKVYQRLILVTNLKKQTKSAKPNEIHYLYPGLITYLILTCFDQLGQDEKGWKFFPDWLNSKKLESERNLVEESISKDIMIIDDQNNVNYEYIRQLYLGYHQIYGIKNSFIRFLTNVLTQEQRSSLLDLIDIEKTYSNVTNGIVKEIEDESKKILWLYELRNNYTHNLESQEKHYKRGQIDSNGERYIWEETIKKDWVKIVFVRESFKDKLEISVIEGLVETIINHSNL